MHDLTPDQARARQIRMLEEERSFEVSFIKYDAREHLKPAKRDRIEAIDQELEQLRKA